MKNYIENNKLIFILSIVFVIVSLFNIIYFSLTQRGLMFDGSIWFTNTLDDFSAGNWHILNTNFFHRQRVFIHLLEFLPVNIAYHWFGVKSKFWLGAIFSIPLILFPFLTTIYNCYLVKRTKRYDMFLYSLINFGVFILPCMMYSIVELYLAVSILLLLLHYLVSNIDYRWYDIVIILFCCIISCHSTEMVVIVGPVLFIAALLLAKKEKNKKNKIVKLVIGIFGTIMFISFIIFITFINSSSTIPLERISNESIYFLSDLREYFNQMYLIFAFLIYIAIINKNKFSMKQHIAIISIYLLYAFIFFHPALLFSYSFFSRRFMLYVVFILFLILLLDDKIPDFLKNNKEVFNNILFVVLVTSIYTTCVQINDSYLFNKSVKQLQAKLEAKEQMFLYADIQMHDFYNSDSFSRIAFHSDTYLYDSILFNKNQTPKAIVYDYTAYVEGDRICTLFSCFSIKNQYWDLTYFAKYLQNK